MENLFCFLEITNESNIMTAQALWINFGYDAGGT